MSAKVVDHAAEAILALHMAARDVSANFEFQTGERKADVLALAQIHATLALVEQQKRTADIIDMLIGNNAYALNVAVRA